MPDARPDTVAPHRHRTAGEIRQRLRRYVTLGIVDEWDELPGGRWRVVAVNGDTATLSTGTAWAFLSGMATGWHAALDECDADDVP